MAVKVIVANIYSKIVGFLPEKVQDELEDTLRFKVPNAKYSKKFKSGQWDGWIRLYRRNGQSFYTGLLSFIREILKKHAIEFSIEDRRIRPEQNFPELKFTPPIFFEERDYQTYTIQKAYKYTRGILSVCTGGGKTFLVAKLIGDIKTYPFVFYVLTKDLMQQAYDVLSSTLNCPIGRIGDGLVDIQKISICTIQTAIRALHPEDKNFKISDYLFDEDEEWDEKGIENAEKAEQIRGLIRGAKGIYGDECVSGDTMIITEKGATRIDKIIENKCRFVQTCDGNNIIYKPIKNWYKSGEKETLKITFLDNKELICTNDHLVLTKRGWIKALDLSKNDFLFCAHAVADKRFLSQINIDHKNTYWGIRYWEGQRQNGKLYINNMSKQLHCVLVGVVKGFCLYIKRWKNLLRGRVPRQYQQNISPDMINNQCGSNIIFDQQREKDRLYWGRVWVIPVCVCQTKDQKILDYILPTGYVKRNGQNIRPNICIDMGSNIERLNVLDLENIPLRLFLCAYQHLRILQKKYIKIIKKQLLKIFLIILDRLVLRGGFVTMDQMVVDICPYTQKDGPFQKTKLFVSGLLKGDLIVRLQNIKKEIKKFFITYDLTQKDRKPCQNTSKNTFPNVCNINWKAIKSIKKGKKIKVYDIEVEDTHCFFANDILVHNCHHTSAKTIKEVLIASENAYWRYGGSATPYRDDNADLIIQAMFGVKIVDISASYLIQKGYLVKPFVFVVPIDSDKDFHSWRKVYKNSVVENQDFHRHVADTARHLVSKDLAVLVLVKEIAHGNYLKALIPNSEFITGEDSTETRKKALDSLRDKSLKSLIATSLADEGLDVPVLDAVIIAGGGASSTRISQRIGRSIRKSKTNPDKTKSIVIIYDHYKTRYLKDHTKKLKRIIKREKEFQIVYPKDKDFVKDEIDVVLGIKNKISDVFSV
jgi:superfamily II DNA or RNA helicase